MSVSAASLVADVSVTGAAGAIADLLRTGAAADTAGGALKAIAGGGLLLAGAAIVGIGIKSVQMAGNFQESMTQLVTGAGESKSNIDMVSQGILNMAVTTGTSTDQLSQGMYMIESAGYHGAAGLAVLQAAAEGAKVGNASLADVANGVTTAMTDYAKSNLSASQATNFLVSVVANGKTHMTDLANSMSTILPTAAAVGVNLKDVGGAMATMTGEGTGAAQASTYLRQMLMAMASPAKAGASALKAIGLTTQEVSDGMKKSLPDTLQMIMTHLAETYKVGSPQYMTALKNISGGAKQMQGMLELTGDHLKTFAGNVKTVGGAMNTGKGAIAGWSAVQGDFNFKIAQAKEVVETLMIRIGQALLPVVTQLMNAIIPLITQFSDWITKSGMLQTMIGNVTGGLKSAGGIFGMVKDLIMTLAVAVGHIIKAFADWMIKGGGLKTIIETVKTVIGNVVPPITHLIGVVGSIITQFITWGNKSGFFTGVLKVMGGVIGGLSGFVGTLIGDIASFIGWMQQGSAPATALGVALLAIGAAIAAMKIGGMVQDIIALLPQMAGWLSATIAQIAVEGTLAIEEIAANLPIYLIIAAILALIAIVVLLITHWSQVTAFFVNLWHGVEAVTITVWNAIKSFFVGLWNGIAATAKTVWNAVAGFFTGLWGTITKAVSTAWNGIVSFFVGIWNTIVAFVKEHALLLLAVITGPIGAIVILIVTHWQQILAFLAGVWTNLLGLATSLWTSITGVFSNAWGGISSALTGLWNNVVNFAKSWPAQALQWGKDMISGLINGITGMVGNVKNAVGNVANAIKGFLHFSKPDVGPLADFDTWMPDFGDALAAQLRAQAPKLQTAMQVMVKPLAATGSSSVSSSMAFPAMAQNPMTQVANSLAQGQGTPIILQINGQQYARVVLPYIVNGIRNATGVRGF